MSSFRQFITNISWNVLGNLSVQLVLLAVSITVTRYLGKERLGIYASILVIPVFVRLLNSMGIETLINKLLPELKVHDPTGNQGKYILNFSLWFRLATSLCFGMAIYFLLPFYLNFISMPQLLDYRVSIARYFMVLTLNSLFSTLFMTLLRYKAVSIVDISGALVNLALLGLFINLDLGILGVLYAFVCATGISILVYGFLARKDFAGETQKPRWGDAKNLAGVSYAISLLSFGLMTQSDIFLMNYFQISPVGIGYYHLATGLAAMLIFLLTGTGSLALSLFSENYARNKSAGLSQTWYEVVGFTIFCMVPIYTFSLFHAEQLIAFIYGTQFSPAGSVFSVYVVFVMFSLFMGSGFSVSTLYVIQKKDAALRSSVEGSILNVVLNIILIPFFGVMGTVVATGSSMVYMAGRQLLCISRTLDVAKILPFIGRCVFLSLVPILPCKIIALFVADHLLLNLLIYGIGLIGMLFWVKPLTGEHCRLMGEVHPGLVRWVKYFAEKPAKTTE